MTPVADPESPGAEPLRPALRPRVTPEIVARSLAFVVFTYGLLVVLALTASPLLLGPRRWALGASRLWARLTLWGFSTICRVRIEVRGREHLPAGGALIAAKHQSMLDTIAPLLLFEDPALVLKRELMRLPFFGWYATRLDMLPIDREGGAKALRAMVHGARERIGAGRQVLIYPEGTRQELGAPPAYKPGVAGLYRELNGPCVLLATNAGVCWPAHGVLRFPGVVVFEFLPAIAPGLKRASFMAVLEDRLEAASDRLVAGG